MIGVNANDSPLLSTCSSSCVNLRSLRLCTIMVVVLIGGGTDLKKKKRKKEKSCGHLGCMSWRV